MINEVHSFKEKADWLKFRGMSIGGSSITSILGLNEYQSPYDLWELLTGRVQPPAMNNHMEAGIYLEQGVSDWFEAVTPHRVVKTSADHLIMEHPKYPFIKASPDRKVFMNGSQKHKDIAIMEIKTTGMNIDPDNLPLQWFIQPLMYAGFWEFDNIIICWYDRFRNTIDYKEHSFDKELFDDIIKAAVEFWNDYVVTDTPPPIRTEADVLRLFPKESQGKIIVADDNVLELYSQAIGLKRQSKEIDKSYNQITEKVKLTMKDSEKVVDMAMNTLFTWKSNKNGSRVFNIKEV